MPRQPMFTFSVRHKAVCKNKGVPIGSAECPEACLQPGPEKKEKEKCIHLF